MKLIFNTKLTNEQNLNGLELKIATPPKYEEYKLKDMRYVEFPNGIKKWVYTTEIDYE